MYVCAWWCGGVKWVQEKENVWTKCRFHLPPCVGLFCHILEFDAYMLLRTPLCRIYFFCTYTHAHAHTLIHTQTQKMKWNKIKRKTTRKEEGKLIKTFLAGFICRLLNTRVHLNQAQAPNWNGNYVWKSTFSSLASRQYKNVWKKMRGNTVPSVLQTYLPSFIEL